MYKCSKPEILIWEHLNNLAKYCYTYSHNIMTISLVSDHHLPHHNLVKKNVELPSEWVRKTTYHFVVC